MTLDDALIKRAAGGDGDAFATLAGEVYDTVYRFALKWCGSVDDAEDITQLAMIKLGRSLNQFRFESKFSTWLYRLVTNTAVDWQRAQQRHPLATADELEAMADQPVQTAPGTDTSHEAALFLSQVLAFVATLGEGLRETLLLVLGQGLSHRECAEVLGVKESTISWRIHHVRKHLPALLDETGSANETSPSTTAIKRSTSAQATASSSSSETHPANDGGGHQL